ncbi:isocitrate lyase/phosphoenolpyruvate mutase family protein [Arthrobacter sp. SX1312]|uniref:isocitrate lyase/PEP mutase family protein n=1 Tax=Arthrobacter sp. SX1312 TaxID=2058896 RepID=UPI000CE4EDD4|nr:isocitrate lyase/phosphoenolpyruvate mutase family protein [Arthrobacter sp. SX1312]
MDFHHFAASHTAGHPLLIVNAWDGASARYLHSLGHRVIGTTSLGSAYAAGHSDGHGRTFADVLALVERCRHLHIPVTADIENGFSDDPREVLNRVRELYEAGAIGINIEDGRPDQSLSPIGLAAEKVEIISQSLPELFINARTDAYWVAGNLSDHTKYDNAVARAQAYVDAGAHGIFVPGVTDRSTIRSLVSAIPAPLNVLIQPGGPTLAELTSDGVARISTGSLLLRIALSSIGTAVQNIQATHLETLEDLPTYSEFNEQGL